MVELAGCKRDHGSIRLHHRSDTFLVPLGHFDPSLGRIMPNADGALRNQAVECTGEQIAVQIAVAIVVHEGHDDASALERQSELLGAFSKRSVATIHVQLIRAVVAAYVE